LQLIFRYDLRCNKKAELGLDFKFILNEKGQFCKKSAVGGWTVLAVSAKAPAI
jgi:hypothetical protein